MKRGLLFLFLILIGFAITIGGVQLWKSSGPSYQSRSLRSWLKDYGSPIGGGLIHDKFANTHRPGPNAATRAAIRAIGTNAVALLLSDLKCSDDPPWLTAIVKLSKRQTFLRLPLRDAVTRREQAAVAFYELGPAGLAALPELARLLTNNSCAVYAAHALAGMGTNAIPAFTTALTNANTWICDCGAWGLAQIGPDARDSVPQLLRIVHSGNSADAMLRVWALGEIGGPVELILPELAKCLGNADPDVRRAAAKALLKLGPAAQGALREIQIALEQESNPETKSELQKLGAELDPAAVLPKAVTP